MNNYRNNYMAIIANASDDQLKQIAKRQAYIQEYVENKGKKPLPYQAMITGTIALDSFIRAGLTPGMLSDKSGAFAKNIGSWGGVLVLGSCYYGALNKIKKQSETVRNFEEQHPLMSTLAYILGFMGVYKLAQKGIDCAKNYMYKNQTEKVAKYLIKKHQIKNKVDNSSFSTKIFQPLANKLGKFATNHPKMSAFGKTLALYATPAILIGLVLKSVSESSMRKQRIEENYYNLKAYQNVALEQNTLSNKTLEYSNL